MKKILLPAFFNLIFILPIVLIACSKQETKPVVLSILAGSSLKQPLKEIKELYSQQNPHVTITYGFSSSGMIQKAIEQGTTADAFITGSNGNIDDLQSKGFILPETHQNLVSSKMVLIVPKNATVIYNFTGLTSNKIKRLAVSDPQIGASGKHALETLTFMNILNQVKPKFVLAKTSVEVLSLVEEGKADAGILFATDALQSNRVKVVAIAPDNSHSPIFWPVAVLKTSQNIPEAKEFVEFLQSDRADSVFIKYGFIIPNSRHAR